MNYNSSNNNLIGTSFQHTSKNFFVSSLKNSPIFSKRTFKFFYIIFGILLFYTVALDLSNRPTDSVSLQWFLAMLRDAPIIPTDWISRFDWSLDDWGAFNWFRDFVVALQKLFAPLEYFVAYVAQLFTYVGYFLGSFFTVLIG